jgi:hypothetical protein
MNKLFSGSFRSGYLATACIIAGFAFYTSCSQDSGLGRNVLPANSISANFVDTSTVVTSLVLEDTVIANDASQYLLGSYTDPVFGPTKASIYTQFILPGGDGANPFVASGLITTNTKQVILDSVVMALPFGSYNGYNYYGELGPQTIQVYALDPKTHFTADSAYYSSAVLPHKTLLGERNVFPQMLTNDSVRYPSNTVAYVSNPRLTIPLNKAWGQQWLDAGLSTFSNLMSVSQNDTMVLSNAAFQRNFPGVYITASSPMQFPGQGGLWYMDPYTSVSGIIFYFRIINPSGSTFDTSYVSTNFGLNTSCVTVSHFDHDYSKTVFNGPKNKKDSVYSPNFIYVQAMGGVMTKIDFPYIMNWVKNNKVIVNRAEVEIPVDGADIGNFPVPTQLYLIGINDTSTVASTSTFTLPDQGSVYYGGTYDAFNQQYVFDIPLYIQEVFNHKTIPHGLYLVAGNSVATANRFVGYGGKGNGPSTKRLRLKLYYTPLKP